jgi:hypothetical protein
MMADFYTLRGRLYQEEGKHRGKGETKGLYV